MEILLTVRRFFCPAPGCGRTTFAEQVEGLTARYARKTPLLARVLERIAVALAGRAGPLPKLQAASDQVRTFATMITQLTGQDLPQWITSTRDTRLPGLSSFAKGLEQDLDAVTNGLTMPWNSGPSKDASITR